MPKVEFEEKVSEEMGTCQSEQEEDSRGLKVRYFRKMSLEAFLKMAKIGYQDAASYAEEGPPDINQEELKRLVIWSLPIDLQDKMEKRKYNFKELVDQNFGQGIYEKMAISNFSYSSVMDFINSYLDEEYLKEVHTGSLMQKISPFLSMSVGGVISTLSNERRSCKKVYCEIVKKDIITHKLGVNGEKEVFVKNLKMSDIAGVYIDDDKIFDLIKKDNTFSQGRFYEENKDNKDNFIWLSDFIQKWRWEVDTNDCLPKRLRDLTGS